MPHGSRDSGFTLLEVLVTISLMGIMMAIAIGGWSSWANVRAQSGTAREILSVLRQAQQRAVTESDATCVLFDTSEDSYTVYGSTCADIADDTDDDTDDAGEDDAVSGPVRVPDNVAVHNPTFVATDESPPAGFTFTGRGTGTEGTVVISGSTRSYTISVNRLSGHASFL